MFYKNLLKALLFYSVIFTCLLSKEKQVGMVFFEQANELYKQGKYDDALAFYRKILNGGSVVFYNMGNCAYKLGNYGYALAYWRKAEHNWGFSESGDLLRNIKILKNKLNSIKKGDQEKHDGSKILQKIKDLRITFDFFIHSIPLIYFQIAFLFAWILIFIFIRRLFRAGRKFLIIMLFTTIAIFGLILVLKYNFENKQRGVVVDKNASLFSGPGLNYQIVGSVPEASELVIEKSTQDFLKIRINGQSGWINKNSIEKF